MASDRQSLSGWHVDGDHGLQTLPSTPTPRREHTQGSDEDIQSVSATESRGLQQLSYVLEEQHSIKLPMENQGAIQDPQSPELDSQQAVQQDVTMASPTEPLALQLPLDAIEITQEAMAGNEPNTRALQCEDSIHYATPGITPEPIGVNSRLNTPQAAVAGIAAPDLVLWPETTNLPSDKQASDMQQQPNQQQTNQGQTSQLSVLIPGEQVAGSGAAGPLMDDENRPDTAGLLPDQQREVLALVQTPPSRSRIGLQHAADPNAWPGGKPRMSVRTVNADCVGLGDALLTTDNLTQQVGKRRQTHQKLDVAGPGRVSPIPPVLEGAEFTVLLPPAAGDVLEINAMSAQGIAGMSPNSPPLDLIQRLGSNRQQSGSNIHISPVSSTAGSRLNSARSTQQPQPNQQLTRNASNTAALTTLSSQASINIPPGLQNVGSLRGTRPSFLARLHSGGYESLASSRTAATDKSAAQQVPADYIPAGLEGVELHVPFHLVADEQDNIQHDFPVFVRQDTYASTRTEQQQQQQPGAASRPPKLLGSVAMPFAERKHDMASQAKGHKAVSGNVVKTAGEAGTHRKAAWAGLPDTYHGCDQQQQHMAKGGRAPVSDLCIEQAMNIRGVSRQKDFQARLVKQRKPGPRCINFRTRRTLPTTIAAGSLGLNVDKVKEGLMRRFMAEEQHLYGPPAFERKYEPRPATPAPCQLDGFMLLAAGDDDMPEGVVAARLSGKNIGSVEPADLTYFCALQVLDLSDNKLPGMTCLATLPCIQALSLSLNHMHRLDSWDAGTAFQTLVTLDLSYNQLDVTSCLGPGSSLAASPRLRELNLSGNGLTQLPGKLGPFPALELLKLADNQLTGRALGPLSMLPALRILNLSKNTTFRGLMATSGDTVCATTLQVCGLEAATSFKNLQYLDLSHCGIEDVQTVEPLRALPSLHRLILAGNPLAVSTLQAQKREVQRRDKAVMLAADGAILPPGALQSPAQDPLLVWQEPDVQGSRPTVAKVLVGDGGRFLAIREGIGRREAERAAAMAAVATVNEEEVGAAFERVDAMIEAWQLNTVPEEDVEDDDDDDGQPVEDNTFLTGVGITERMAVEQPGHMTQEEAGQVTESRPLWEDITDPTERLAIALGLDPRRLAIYTGRPTQDALGAVNALRFALTHPLVEADDGIGTAPNHLALTQTARAKRRVPAGKLQPLTAGSTGINMPPDARTAKIQTVEGMLQSMKSRLNALESTLQQKLAAIPAQHTQPARTARLTIGISDQGDADLEAELDCMSPDEVLLRQIELPFQTRTVRDDDAGSDLSSLSSEVVAAIDNSDPSDHEGPFTLQSDDEDGPQSPSKQADAAQSQVQGLPAMPAPSVAFAEEASPSPARTGSGMVVPRRSLNGSMRRSMNGQGSRSMSRKLSRATSRAASPQNVPSSKPTSARRSRAGSPTRM